MPFPIVTLMSLDLLLMAWGPATILATAPVSPALVATPAAPLPVLVAGKHEAPAAAPKAAKPEKHRDRRGHQFVPLIEGVALIQFRVPDPAKPPEHQITRATAQAQYGFWCDITEGERLRVELRDATGALLHTIHDYVVPVGSEATIVLPR